MSTPSRPKIANRFVAIRRANTQAGIDNPRAALSLTDIHDCFSVAKLATLKHLNLWAAELSANPLGEALKMNRMVETIRGASA